MNTGAVRGPCLTICVLGAGIMAQGMIGRLQRAGFPLRLYNRTRSRSERLATERDCVCRNPAEAAHGADVILCSVADDEAAETVWFGAKGALQGARPGVVAIETSTLSISQVERWAQRVGEAGLLAVDAPVTGSRRGAQSGTLVVFLGCTEAGLRGAEPVFQQIAERTIFFGPPGSGTRFKLVYNLVGAGIGAVFAEGLALAEAVGMQGETVLNAFLNTGWGSKVASSKGRAMLDREHADVHYAMRLMHKDLCYALAAASEKSLRLPCAEAVLDAYSATARSGWGYHDISAIREATHAVVLEERE